MHQRNVPWTLILIFLAAGCSEEGSEGNKNIDGGTDEPSIWGAVSLTEVSAPDEYTLIASFDEEPVVEDLENLDHYSATSNYGELTLETVQYDSASLSLTFTTAKQKLGVTYTLNLLDEGGSGISEDFLAADEAVFWLDDIHSAGYNQYQQKAVRTAAGDHAVVYVDTETGFLRSGEIVAWFDSQIYPIETELFTEGSDVDGNGRVVLLFTDMGSACAGWCSSVDVRDEEDTMSRWGLHSNQMELIYVNSHEASVNSYLDTLAHEYQHILYFAEHGDEGWAYHNEGLSECAVRAASGGNNYFIEAYFNDYSQTIAQGLSLLNWDFSDSTMAYYANSFLFWSYLAGQLNGLDTYGDIFHLESGHPNDVNDFIQDQLGISLPQAHFNQLLANWVQDDTGTYSYQGFIDVQGTPPTVPYWQSSVDLEPFMGTFFALNQTSVDYPGTQGPNIRYAGIDSSGNVDLTAPFNVGPGGGLLVHNSAFDASYPAPTEHSGPDISSSKNSENGVTSLAEPIGAFDGVYPAHWFNPPPFNPENPEPYLQWERRNIDRMIAIEQKESQENN